LPQQLERLHIVKLLTLAGGVVESVAGIWAVLAAFPSVVILMSVVIRLILIPSVEIIGLIAVVNATETVFKIIHDYLT
jgi:hypothetical protein